MIYTKALRLEKGYTQKALAEAIDCSPATVKNWDQGISKPLNYNKVKLSKVLDMCDKCEHYEKEFGYSYCPDCGNALRA